MFFLEQDSLLSSNALVAETLLIKHIVCFVKNKNLNSRDVH